MMRIQAEDALLNGAVVATTRDGAEGSYVDFQNKTEDFIEWTVEVAAAGSYDLSFRYANGDYSERPLSLSVNGTEQVSALTLPHTGGWASWDTATQLTALSAGTNTIRLTATGKSGPNFDWLEVPESPTTTDDDGSGGGSGGDGSGGNGSGNSSPPADAAPIAFTEVTDAAGVAFAGRSYGSAWGDFDGDGLPDLWVNNHFGAPPSLYINQGDGTFNDAYPEAFADPSQGDLHGAAWADFDNDGDQDLVQLVAGENEARNLPPDSEPNRMYVNESGTLVDRAAELGLRYDTARAQTPVWLDYDNDGRLDLFHTSTTRPDGLTPTTIFRQTDSGFEDVGDTVLPSGRALEHASVWYRFKESIRKRSPRASHPSN